MSKRDFRSVESTRVHGAAQLAVSWAQIRGGLMSLHLLALTTTVLVHATAMLSQRSSPWGHVVLAILLVPLTLETTKRVVQSAPHVVTQLTLASGMALITFAVLLQSLSASSWVLVIAVTGAALLLYGQANAPAASTNNDPRVSSIGR